MTGNLPPVPYGQPYREEFRFSLDCDEASWGVHEEITQTPVASGLSLEHATNLRDRLKHADASAPDARDAIRAILIAAVQRAATTNRP